MKIIAYDNSYKNQIIDLIDEIYHEYGDEIFLEGYDADLLDIPAHYGSDSGNFWLLIDEKKRVRGTFAIRIAKKDNDKAEYKRLYIHKDFRGTGAANEFLEVVYNWCKNNKINTLFFWSDTRFKRAHAFFQKQGFKKGTIRHMDDGAMPYSEYYFEKTLINEYRHQQTYSKKEI